MGDVVDAVKKRIEDFILANTTTLFHYNANTSPAVLTVNNARFFNIEWAAKELPQILIFDPNVGTGTTLGSTSNIIRAEIISSDKLANTITLRTAPTINIPVGWKVVRAPNFMRVKTVIKGDPTTVPLHPAICVNVVSNDEEWTTLSATTDKVTLEIICHVKEDKLSDTITSLRRITDDIRDLLNADLHIKIDRFKDGYNRTFNSFASNAQYGYTQKEEGLFRSSKITWTGSEFWSRFHLSQDPSLSPFD